MIKCLNELNSADFNLEHKLKNLTIYYKKDKDKPTITIKCVGILDTCLNNLISVIYETDLYPKWLPFCFKVDL